MAHLSELHEMSKSALLYRGRRDAIETTHAVDILENFRSRIFFRHIFLQKFRPSFLN